MLISFPYTNLTTGLRSRIKLPIPTPAPTHGELFYLNPTPSLEINTFEGFFF